MKNLNKIFVSTTFAKNDSKISEVLLTCKKANISNIELGSNHCYEKNYKKIIKKHKLNFIVHNYFPIPKKSFVVNIASANRVIRNLSIKHVKNAILFCKTTNSKLYTFHPGFIFDPVTASNSKKNYDFIWNNKIQKRNHNTAFNLMLNGLKKIIKFAKKNKVKVAIRPKALLKKNIFY